MWVKPLIQVVAAVAYKFVTRWWSAYKNRKKQEAVNVAEKEVDALSDDDVAKRLRDSYTRD